MTGLQLIGILVSIITNFIGRPLELGPPDNVQLIEYSWTIRLTFSVLSCYITLFGLPENWNLGTWKMYLQINSSQNPWYWKLHVCWYREIWWSTTTCCPLLNHNHGCRHEVWRPRAVVANSSKNLFLTEQKLLQISRDRPEADYVRYNNISPPNFCDMKKKKGDEKEKILSSIHAIYFFLEARQNIEILLAAQRFLSEAHTSSSTGHSCSHWQELLRTFRK